MPDPRHVAVIMDGNGRWAKARGLPRGAGHAAGREAIRRTVRAAIQEGVPWLSLFAFSTENWRRPEDEVRLLFRLFEEVLWEETPETAQAGEGRAPSRGRRTSGGKRDPRPYR